MSRWIIVALTAMVIFSVAVDFLLGRGVSNGTLLQFIALTGSFIILGQDDDERAVKEELSRLQDSLDRIEQQLEQLAKEEVNVAAESAPKPEG